MQTNFWSLSWCWHGLLWNFFLGVLNTLHQSWIHVWGLFFIWRICRFLSDLLNCNEHAIFLVAVPIYPIFLYEVKSFWAMVLHFFVGANLESAVTCAGVSSAELGIEIIWNRGSIRWGNSGMCVSSLNELSYSGSAVDNNSFVFLLQRDRSKKDLYIVWCRWSPTWSIEDPIVFIEYKRQWDQPLGTPAAIPTF